LGRGSSVRSRFSCRGAGEFAENVGVGTGKGVTKIGKGVGGEVKKLGHKSENKDETSQ